MHSAVVIAQVELRQRTGGVVGVIIDLAMMSVTAEYIPIESSYERIVASRLVEQSLP